MAKRTRSDIIQMIWETSTHGASKSQVESIIKETLVAIANEIRIGNSVELKGFATFKPVMRKPRTGYNLKTREPIQIPAHRACAVKAKFKMDS